MDAIVYDVSVAEPILVGVTLVVLAATLLFAGRRRPEGVVLAVFLVLVAANFVFNAIASATGEGIYAQLAFIALAFDPFYLLFFVSLYPIHRRSRWTRALLALIGASSLVSAAFVILRPDLTTDFHFGAQPFAAPHLLLIANLAVAYLAAFAFALRSAIDAPTASLRERARWAVAAVGITVLPRLAFVRNDFGLPWLGFPPPTTVEAGSLLSVGLIFAGVALDLGLAAASFQIASLLAWSRRSMRDKARLEVAPVRRFLIFAIGALALVSLAVSILATVAAPDLAIVSTKAILYSLRWPMFAAILVYGLLAYEILEFDRAADHVFPVIGGVVGSAGVALFAAALLPPFGFSQGESVGLALALGLAAAVPAAVGMRELVHGVEARIGRRLGASDRRMELYRAALEAAWAHAPPDREARDRLDRDRRAFGVSFEEARALEHVVAAAARPASRALAPGDEPIPGIVIEDAIGEGAHGRVFAARRYPSGESVAVKEVRSDVLGEPGARRQFLAEVRPLLAFAHPNIVPLLDARVEDGRRLLVMGHVDGEPLSRRLARGALPEREVRSIVLQLLDALESAHARGIVHRDVKPENVLVGRDGRVFLTDFGVATVLTEDGGAIPSTVSDLVAHGELVGSLAYMAPEQARGERATPATDVFAVGLVAIEALRGRATRNLRGLSLYGALDLIARTRPAVDEAPTTWRPILSRALAVDAAERYASAAEMRRAVLTLVP